MSSGLRQRSADMARNPLLENAVDTYDASISLSNQRNPSSMGITCIIKPVLRRFWYQQLRILQSGIYENARDPVLICQNGTI